MQRLAAPYPDCRCAGVCQAGCCAQFECSGHPPIIESSCGPVVRTGERVAVVAAAAATCASLRLLTQTSSTVLTATKLLVVVSAIHRYRLGDLYTMPSSALLNPPVALLACYNPSHVVDSFDFHAEHVAFLERSRLLHKNPLPSSALATSRLSPPCPLPPVHFSQQLHRDMASDEGEFFRAAHISLAEFTLLHAYLYTAILTSQNHRETASPHVHLVESQLTPADQLLLWLFHLAGDRTVQLSAQFGHHHPSTVFRYVDHITFCINTVLADIIAWPTAEQRKLMYGMMSVCHEAVAVLDGTHCAVQAPSTLNNTYYSGYKHKHTNNYLVCVDYLGVILSVEGAYPGRANDREVYNGCD